MSSEEEKVEQALTDIEGRTSPPPSRQDLRRVERKSSYSQMFTIGIVGIISVAALLYGSTASEESAEAAARAEMNRSSIQSLQMVNRELARNGMETLPVPEPSDDEVDVDAMINAVTVIVLNELREDPSFRGPDGEDGMDGARGPRGEPCNPRVMPECVGPDGQPGTDGTNGTDGTDGSDGTNGVDGKDGVDGTDGADGEDGRGIINAQFETFEEACHLRLDYDAPDENGNNFQRLSVPEEFCPEEEPAGLPN